MTTAAVAPEPVFVDTNLLVYAAFPAFPLHVDARMRLTELEAAGVCLWISRQTLREYLSALSRPSAYSPPIPMTSLIGDVSVFLSRFQVVEDGPAVTSALLTILAAVPRREASVRRQHRRHDDDSKHPATPHPQRQRLCSFLDLGRYPPAVQFRPFRGVPLWA